MTELIHFNLAWYAMNAIFSRKAILDLLGPPASQSELDKFRLLFGHASLSGAASVATLDESISRDSCKHTEDANGEGDPAALTSKNLSALDLPMLNYLMRRWRWDLSGRSRLHVITISRLMLLAGAS
ncbi:MAG: hypothetical protein ACT4O5_04065 [Gammaproteobacteria bacterium]